MKVFQYVLLFWWMAKTTSLSVSAPGNHDHYLLGVSEPLGDLLKATSNPDCSVILLADEEASAYSAAIVKELPKEGAPRGTAVFDMTQDKGGTNSTDQVKQNLLSLARKLRRASWCTVVVLVSENLDFLTSFAELSLQGRLLVWMTKLIVVTRLLPLHMNRLLNNFWTFNMMNAMFLNLNKTATIPSWSVYAHLPYSPKGAVDVKVASWNQQDRLRVFFGHTLFPEKFSNFHGAVVNVAGMEFPPYWLEEEYTKADGTKGKKFFGADGELLRVLARSLNFTVYVMPLTTWDEALQLVRTRKAFFSAHMWTMLPERLEHFDMTYVYEYAFISFAMANPLIEPNWQSLIYPLSNNVWLSILISIMIVPAVLYVISITGREISEIGNYGAGMAAMEIIGTLLGQNLSNRLPKIDSGRMLMMVWLVFAFIIGSAYRGNLTAHLTLPRYPYRPESVEELVDFADKLIGGPYSYYYIDYFSKSTYKPFLKLSAMMEVGESIHWGLERALENKRTSVGAVKRFMQYLIADQFTGPDGNSKLYIGRTDILPGLGSRLTPHDAPYSSNLERPIRAVIEGGLFDKWSSEQVEKSQSKSIKRQRKDSMDKETEETDNAKGSQDNEVVLTLTHMLGPLLLFLIGNVLAFVSLITEFISTWYFLVKENKKKLLL